MYVRVLNIPAFYFSWQFPTQQSQRKCFRSPKACNQTVLKVTSMEDLCYLDAMLTLAGNRLNSRIWGIRKLGRTSNWIVRMFITVSSVVSISFTMINIFPETGLNLQVIQDLTSVSLGLLATAWFAVRRRKIKRLIKIVADDDPTLKQIRRSTLRALILISGYLIYNLVISYISLRRWRLPYLLRKAFYFLVSIPIILNQFSAFYPLLYLTCIQLLTSYEVSDIQKFKSWIASGRADVMTIIKKRYAVTMLKQEFESLLNVVPFAMLGNMFITIPSGIINISSRRRTHMYDYIPYALFHGIVLFLIYQLVQTVCRCRRKVRDKISELIRCIQEKSIKDPHTRGYQSLIDELRIDQQFVFTGWYLFPINRTIILSFVSSIITFSVLQIQLASNSL